jgi:hypothetical protein
VTLEAIDVTHDDASRSRSSGAHSRDPLAMRLRMRSSILRNQLSVLMVRSAAAPRVSNHEPVRHSVELMAVARMSEAISGDDRSICPGCRFAHPGYGAEVGGFSRFRRRL